MSQFFNPTTQRVQPLRQEGVIDTIRPWNIVGYSFENNTAHSASSITITGAATATGVATVAITVNPASQAFFGQNVRNINVSLVAGDSTAIVAAKVRAAIAADLLFSAYYNITVVGSTVSILPKQAQDVNANLTAYVFTAGPTGVTTGAPIVGVAPLVNPLARVGRLVYTPSNASNPSVIRVIEPGAVGVVRGFTAWCPDVEYDDVTKTEVLRPFWRHDVMDRGVINLDAVTAGQGYGGTSNSTLFVYVTGINQGKIRIGADAGAVALFSGSFPNLFNLPGCTIHTFEPSLGSNTITKFAVEIN
jgi:hypothetical protein